jgi:adenosine deaminase
MNSCDPLAMSDLLHRSVCTLHMISDDRVGGCTIWQNNPAVGMTKRSYMEAVMAGFNTDSIAFNRIYVRLILSIDRRETTEAAIETVRLAFDMRQEGCEIVGIDLSGDPAIGEWKTFLPALTLAREMGLPLALHCGEVCHLSPQVLF